VEERGTVIASAGGIATVRIERSAACEGCTACALSETGMHMIARAADSLGVLPGDRVRIETPGASQLSALALLFLMPLAALFAGYGAGALVARVAGSPAASPAAGAAGAVVFCLASFGLLAVLTRRARAIRRAPQSMIVEKLPAGS